MKLLLEQDEKMENVLNNISNVIDGKWFYIPGWFEKHEDGTFQFHHVNNLPTELTTKLEEIKEHQEKEVQKEEELKSLTKKESHD